MSDKPISPLRQRMIDDMTARRFKEKVQKDYVRHVRTFAAFLGRSPDTATSEDLRRFQLHMAQQQISAATINAAIAALRFFFTVTLERPDLVRPLRIVNRAAQGAGRAEPGGGGASPRSRARPQVQGRAQRRLRRGPAGVRGRGPEGVRHRQWAHDAPGRAGQGAAGSLCDAVAATARTLARMVAGGAAAGLALSRPEPDQSDDGPPAQPRRHAAAKAGGDLQARLSAYAAAQLRHPSARAGRRHSRDPGVARPRQARDDRALHPRRRQHGPRHQEPAGAAGRQPREADRRPPDRGRMARPRVTAWRSPTSFAPMGRRGARPTPVT